MLDIGFDVTRCPALLAAIQRAGKGIGQAVMVAGRQRIGVDDAPLHEVAETTIREGRLLRIPAIRDFMT